MDLKTRITRLDAMVTTEVAGELVGLDIERGNCFGFNATATRVWYLTEQSPTFGELCDALIAEHDVDLATCLSDTAAVLHVLAEERLVSLSAA